jgi:hypothetical protein
LNLIARPSASQYCNTANTARGSRPGLREGSVKESKTLNQKRKPFIVDAPAAMLKRHAKLSRNARNLYCTLRALAEGRTGDLKILGRWRRASEFDRASEMCRCVRLKAMRELVATGLVTVHRERVERFLNGRRRVVMGPCHYTVHRPILQQSISSIVEEIDSQFVSNPPMGARGSVFPDSENDSGSESAKSSSARGPADDDSRGSQSNFKGNGNGIPNRNPPAEEKQTHVEKILDRAAAILEKRGDDPLFVAEALAFIDQRSYEARSVPASERYYLTAYENLLDARDDLAEVTGLMIRKKSLRAKFMPDPISPNEKDEEKIRFVHQVVEEAARIGRPACEVMTDRLASDASAIACNRQMVKK